MAQNHTCDVPVFLQPPGSTYCGAASAKMVLAYHGRRYSLRRLVKEMGVRETCGIDLPRLGLWFLRHGFEVELTWCSLYMPPSYLQIAEPVDPRRLNSWCRRQSNSPDIERRHLGRSLARFLKAGGQLRLQPVSLTDLRRALNRGEPPILNIDSAALRSYRSWGAYHYVVPRAILNGQVMINDPAAKTAEPVLVPTNWLMFACHTCSAAALFIHPKAN